jgi:hypothetical protein
MQALLVVSRGWSAIFWRFLLGTYLSRVLARSGPLNKEIYEKRRGQIGQIADQKTCDADPDRKPRISSHRWQSPLD